MSVGWRVAVIRWLWVAVMAATPWASWARETPRSESRLRIQLHWVHQAQFAGFYMAQDRGLFKREGLTVELIPGGPGINPVKAVQDGQADIAVAWMSEAWSQVRTGPTLTNVAQLQQLSSLGLLCRTKAGVVGLSDLPQHAVGFWGLGDDVLVKEMARQRGVDPKSLRFETQQPDAKDLISGKLACATAMAYNEKLLADAAGLTGQETLWIVPEAVGMSHLEDALYVRHDRLSSPEFRDQLVRLLRALREGWAQTRAAPSLALDYTFKRVANADVEHQRQMLEATLATMPVDRPFGQLSLEQWELQAQYLSQGQAVTPDEYRRLWTHQIVNELSRREGKQRFLLPSTYHYLKQIEESWVVRSIIVFGMVAFGVSGFLVAVRAGYGPWGQLVLALITPMGGGLIRDMLVGGERWPAQVIKDPTVPIAIIFASLCVSALLRFRPQLQDGQWVRKLAFPADLAAIPAFSLIGVMVALGANLHWMWGLICAAVSVAGGGILRDLLMNKEPASLRPGVGIEVAAAAGAAVLVAGLFWANRFEYTPWPVYLSMGGCVVVSVGLALWPRLEAWRKARSVSTPMA